MMPIDTEKVKKKESCKVNIIIELRLEKNRILVLI